MRIENYSTLKSASKVSLAKAKDLDGTDIVQLTEKRFDASTGSALSDSVREVNINDYKSEKASLESEKAGISAKITELGKIITDIEAL
jgi:hypothetical protein